MAAHAAPAPTGLLATLTEATADATMTAMKHAIEIRSGWRRAALAAQAVAILTGLIALAVILADAGLTGWAMAVLFAGVGGEGLTVAWWWSK